jgi:hypothetical protein
MIYRKHHRRSLEAVLRDYRSYHARVVALIGTLRDTDLVTLGRFSWTGVSWTLSDYLRASTAAHYCMRTRIRRWWRSHVRNKTHWLITEPPSNKCADEVRARLAEARPSPLIPVLSGKQWQSR